MHVESIRRYCLSLPGAKEKLQWGETLCFKIGEKLFATVDLDVSSKVRLALKCTPEEFAELMERDGIRPAPYVGRYHWAGLERLDSVEDEELEELIRASYDIVSAKISRKLRKAPKRKKR